MMTEITGTIRMIEPLPKVKDKDGELVLKNNKPIIATDKRTGKPMVRVLKVNGVSFYFSSDNQEIGGIPYELAKHAVTTSNGMYELVGGPKMANPEMEALTAKAKQADAIVAAIKSGAKMDDIKKQFSLV